MSRIDDLSVQPIDQRLALLGKRQRHLMVWFFLSSIFLVATVAALFLQKEFVYRFFDLSTQVQALDLPYHLRDLVPFESTSDYFFNLLSWFGWLFLKIFTAFTGAFLLVRWIKKIRFFQPRFQSWTQRIIAWLIAFILLWSGLSYVQYNLNDEKAEAYQHWIEYQTNIEESDIAQDVQHAEISRTEKAYVLAQVALLQQPIDRKTADFYVDQLIDAEKNDPTQFNKYGFMHEQLWVMQQQLYGKSITSATQDLDIKAQKAEKISQILRIISLILIIIFISFSSILYLLAQHLKQRRERIVQKLE